MTERLRSRGVRFSASGVVGTAEPAEGAHPAQSQTAEKSADVRAAATEHDVPLALLVIGLCEFARSVSLAVMFGMMLADPHSHVYSEGYWMAFYVLSNGAMAVTPFLPLTIVYAFAVGTSLWTRAAWGRMALIATSCWAIFRLARYLISYQTLDLGATVSDVEIAHLSYLREAAWLLMALNIGLGAYLAFGPGVAKAFQQKKPPPTGTRITAGE